MNSETSMNTTEIITSKCSLHNRHKRPRITTSKNQNLQLRLLPKALLKESGVVSTTPVPCLSSGWTSRTGSGFVNAAWRPVRHTTASKSCCVVMHQTAAHTTAAQEDTAAVPRWPLAVVQQDTGDSRGVGEPHRRKQVGGNQR